MHKFTMEWYSPKLHVNINPPTSLSRTRSNINYWIVQMFTINGLCMFYLVQVTMFWLIFQCPLMHNNEPLYMIAHFIHKPSPTKNSKLTHFYILITSDLSTLKLLIWSYILLRIQIYIFMIINADHKMKNTLIKVLPYNIFHLFN